MKKKGKDTKIFENCGAFILFVSYELRTIKGMHWLSWWTANHQKIPSNPTYQKNWICPIS
jgi:hypothetical protein